jgi:hypothetical protein
MLVNGIDSELCAGVTYYELEPEDPHYRLQMLTFRFRKIGS